MATTVQDKKEIVRQFFDVVWHDGNLDTVDELFTAEHRAVGIPSAQESVDRDGHKAFIAMIREAYPDVHYAYDPDEIVVDDDSVAVPWTATGTHEGDLMGIEPTGNDVSVRGIFIARFEDDEIAESEVVWDELGMLRQLGVVPELPAQ